MDPKRVDLVAMQGSVRTGYGGRATISAEHNVRMDVPAARITFAAPWRSSLVTPLDTCGRFRLDGEDYQRVFAQRADPVMRTVLEIYELCGPEGAPNSSTDAVVQQRSTTLYDIV